MKQMAKVVRIGVRRARSRRITGWVVVCSEHGMTGDPTVERWSKAKAIKLAKVHVNHHHPMGEVELVVDSR